MNDFWNKQLGEGWSAILADLLSSEYGEKLIKKLNEEYKSKRIYPNKKNIFKAFKETPWENLRVVILGREPYYDGTGTGLAFANSQNTRSLDLSSELQAIEDLHYRYAIKYSHFWFDASLEAWAKQGVLMLNTSLTVGALNICSHTKYWKKFTEHVLKAIAENRPDCIFILWGKHAQSFKPLISNCHILEYSHPACLEHSDLKWDCPNFNEVNEILEAANGPEYRILW